MAPRVTPVHLRIIRSSLINDKGCWLWRRKILKSGYGDIGINGKSVLAHRASYEAFRGPIPNGAQVCHKCDVKSCVNPEHLFLGTQKQNQADMVAKGRSARGEMASSAKLTERAVREIRRALPSYGYREALSKKFGVSPGSVSNIRARRTWAHVGE
jgi:hypothetical protein